MLPNLEKRLLEDWSSAGSCKGKKSGAAGYTLVSSIMDVGDHQGKLQVVSSKVNTSSLSFFKQISQITLLTLVS